MTGSPGNIQNLSDNISINIKILCKFEGLSTNQGVGSSNLSARATSGKITRRAWRRIAADDSAPATL